MSPRHEDHEILLAHALAQAEALLTGRTGADAYRDTPGNRPSTTIVMPALDAFSLGALIALYEHKVYAQSVLWGVNAFDQFGVELGKTIAGRILPAVRGESADLHPATRHLLGIIHKMAQTD